MITIRPIHRVQRPLRKGPLVVGGLLSLRIWHYGAGVYKQVNNATFSAC